MAIAAGCGNASGPSDSEGGGQALTLDGGGTAAMLPADYRQQTIPVESPLVLEWSFGGAATNKVKLNVVNYPGMDSDLFFVHVHANEKTSRKAGENAIKQRGGTLMYLTHSTSEREVNVKIGTRSYTFDPNRIFTKLGLETKTAPVPTGDSLTQLRSFVEWVKGNITVARGQRARPMVTALHNNTDDDTEGSLLSIKTEQDLLRPDLDNREVHANPAWDIDNFFIATLKPTYDALVSAHDPNISLRLEHPRDIGYMSNWMIDTGVDYLNVETQHGDEAGNAQMVEMVQQTFR